MTRHGLAGFDSSTGVDVPRFSRGEGAGFRARHGIPADAFVIGYVGRLAPEKNLDFLASSVARFMAVEKRAHFLIIGTGPCEREIRQTMADQQLTSRLHLPGLCQGQDLIDAFHAMDVFAFASQTETQGMVLTEAMADLPTSFGAPDASLLLGRSRSVSQAQRRRDANRRKGVWRVFL